MTTFIVRRRYAAVAPERPVRESTRLPSEVYSTCVEWAQWSATRGRFGAPRQPGSVMGQLLRVPSTAGDERSGRCDREIAIFNWYVVNHEDQIARRMFEIHFRRDGNVGSLAREAGVSRATWYRAVNAFAEQVYHRHLAP